MTAIEQVAPNGLGRGNPVEPVQSSLPAPGRWVLDPSRSAARATIRHALFTKVHIDFPVLGGTVDVAVVPEESSVEAVVGTAGVDSGDVVRDERIRSADFLDVNRYPQMTFRSTRVYAHGKEWCAAGDLSIRGRSHPVVLTVHDVSLPAVREPGPTARFKASTVLERAAFGLTWNQVVETGGLLLGHLVRVDLTVCAVLSDVDHASARPS